MQSQISPVFLDSISLFSGLDESILQQLCTCCKISHHASGETLYYEKEEDPYLHFIVYGGVKFYKVDRYDNEIFLYHLGANTLVFDAAKICQDHCFVCYANAEFTQDSEVLSFESEAFRAVLKATPALMQRILKESFRDISQLQCIINRDVIFDGSAKVAHMIVSDLENFNTLKKHEIAYMLHIQPETLSRILKKLERNGVIAIEKNCVIIRDENALREIYE